MLHISHFNWFDVVLLVVICLSLMYGLMRGFVREIISLITWIAAFFIAILFSSDLSVYFSQYIKTEFLVNLISFLTLFIVTLIVGALVNYIISQFVQKSGMTIADRFLGAVFGFCRGILVCILIIFLLSNTSLQDKKWFQNASLTFQLQNISAWVQDRVVPVTQKAINSD